MSAVDDPSADTGHGATLVVGSNEQPPTNADDIGVDRLVVLTFRDHEDWLDAVYSDPGGGPDALICAGEMLRSAAATVATEDDSGPTVVDIPTIDDLGEIAVAVTDAVDEARAVADRIAVVVHGLEEAVAAVGIEQTFRLIHVLRGHTQGGGDDLTVYLDPADTDEEAPIVLGPLFDRVLKDDIPAERREHVGI